MIQKYSILEQLFFPVLQDDVLKSQPKATRKM